VKLADLEARLDDLEDKVESIADRSPPTTPQLGAASETAGPAPLDIGALARLEAVEASVTATKVQVQALDWEALQAQVHELGENMEEVNGSVHGVKEELEALEELAAKTHQLEENMEEVNEALHGVQESLAEVSQGAGGNAENGETAGAEDMTALTEKMASVEQACLYPQLQPAGS
jgi:chromosome segregation ATPase